MTTPLRISLHPLREARKSCRQWLEGLDAPRESLLTKLCGVLAVVRANVDHHGDLAMLDGSHAAGAGAEVGPMDLVAQVEGCPAKDVLQAQLKRVHGLPVPFYETDVWHAAVVDALPSRLQNCGWVFG